MGRESNYSTMKRDENPNSPVVDKTQNSLLNDDEAMLG